MLLVVVVVCVDGPEVVASPFRDVFRCQQAHENAMVLVVVFKRSVAAYNLDAFKLPEVLGDGGDMVLVSAAIDWVALGNAQNLCVDDGDFLGELGSLDFLAREVGHRRIGAGPLGVVRVAPIFHRQNRAGFLAVEFGNPISEIRDAAASQVRCVDVNPVVGKENGFLDAEIDDNSVAETQGAAGLIHMWRIVREPIHQLGQGHSGNYLAVVVDTVHRGEADDLFALEHEFLHGSREVDYAAEFADPCGHALVDDTGALGGIGKLVDESFVPMAADFEHAQDDLAEGKFLDALRGEIRVEFFAGDAPEFFAVALEENFKKAPTEAGFHPGFKGAAGRFAGNFDFEVTSKAGKRCKWAKLRQRVKRFQRVMKKLPFVKNPREAVHHVVVVSHDFEP